MHEYTLNQDSHVSNHIQMIYLLGDWMIVFDSVIVVKAIRWVCICIEIKTKHVLNAMYKNFNWNKQQVQADCIYIQHLSLVVPEQYTYTTRNMDIVRLS